MYTIKFRSILFLYFRFSSSPYELYLSNKSKSITMYRRDNERGPAIMEIRLIHNRSKFQHCLRHGDREVCLECDVRSLYTCINRSEKLVKMYQLKYIALKKQRISARPDSKWHRRGHISRVSDRQNEDQKIFGRTRVRELWHGRLCPQGLLPM